MKRRTRAVQTSLLRWYAANKRDLPWRRTRDPYAIWLSEVMLQQTRVETVIPYYERMLRAFPSVHALAEAPLDDVLAHWSGLGYYRRARMLHAAANEIVRTRGGRFPSTASDLMTLTGVGRYTAGAVASIAWSEAVPVVDGNVARVLSRLRAEDCDVRTPAGARRAWTIAAELVAVGDPSSWNQALMELGATVCLPAAPRCDACPVRRYCAAHAAGLQTSLPPVRRRRAPPVFRCLGFVLGSGAAVLLGRRVKDGLFGGMWEPPEVPDPGPRARKPLLAWSGATLRRRGIVRHTLTHRRLVVSVHAGEVPRIIPNLLRSSPDYDAFEWVSPERLRSLALTTLAQKVLAAGGRSVSHRIAVRARRGHSDG